LTQHNNRTIGLIVIGDEILSGRRADKHMPRLLELLKERGLQLSWAEYIADDPQRIIATFKRSFASGDIVFVTGGIGSTPDDHTRQCAAKALGLDLVLHPEAKELIGQRIVESAEGDPVKGDVNSVLNQPRLRMGEFPKGASIIPNTYNKIPGFHIQEHYFMPGFPVMASPMMAWILDTFYAHLFHQVDFVERSFIAAGAMEATITPLMEAIEKKYPEIKVFSLPSVGDPTKEGIFAQRHMELGVKGPASHVEEALKELRVGVEAFNTITYDLVK
jgi:molybdopterin-biosynthesis enzyme MoeA-like protein